MDSVSENNGATRMKALVQRARVKTVVPLECKHRCRCCESSGMVKVKAVVQQVVQLG